MGSSGAWWERADLPVQEAKVQFLLMPQLKQWGEATPLHHLKPPREKSPAEGEQQALLLFDDEARRRGRRKESRKLEPLRRPVDDPNCHLYDQEEEDVDDLPLPEDDGWDDVDDTRGPPLALEAVTLAEMVARMTTRMTVGEKSEEGAALQEGARDCDDLSLGAEAVEQDESVSGDTKQKNRSVRIGKKERGGELDLPDETFGLAGLNPAQDSFSKWLIKIVLGQLFSYLGIYKVESQQLIFFLPIVNYQVSYLKNHQCYCLGTTQKNYPIVIPDSIRKKKKKNQVLGSYRVAQSTNS